MEYLHLLQKLVPAHLDATVKDSAGHGTYVRRCLHPTYRRPLPFNCPQRPLRRIRVMVNEALARMDELFSRMYEADVKAARVKVVVDSVMQPAAVFRRCGAP
jgi:hypothetical protein